MVGVKNVHLIQDQTPIKMIVFKIKDVEVVESIFQCKVYVANAQKMKFQKLPIKNALTHAKLTKF